jgi:cytochrome b involved in lipid metabolism|uniref:Cytochrome b5 heme-binding domain-containing protein n=1 Tax=Eutreptiella gymnastica TaxID=73025 RepID=A0A7S4GLM8_9EUGL
MFAHQMPTYTYEPDGRRTAQMPDFAPVTRGSRKFTLEELATHKTVEDGWICVNNKVYDITNFVKHHPGNDLGGKVSTLLAIKRTLGTDCSEEFMEIHQGTVANAWVMLKDYYIGDLDVAQFGGQRH